MSNIVISSFHLQYPRIAKCFLTYSPNLSVETFWENSSQLQIYAAKFLQEWREKYEIDAVICPAFPVVACPKDAVYILNRKKPFHYIKLYIYMQIKLSIPLSLFEYSTTIHQIEKYAYKNRIYSLGFIFDLLHRFVELFHSPYCSGLPCWSCACYKSYSAGY